MSTKLTLLENFWSHVTRGATDLREQMELVFVHDPAKPKVGDHNICVFLFGTEE